MESLRLSLKYGPPGDLHWFANLSHEDQVQVIAYEWECNRQRRASNSRLPPRFRR